MSTASSRSATRSSIRMGRSVSCSRSKRTSTRPARSSNTSSTRPRAEHADSPPAAITAMPGANGPMNRISDAKAAHQHHYNEQDQSGSRLLLCRFSAAGMTV